MTEVETDKMTENLICDESLMQQHAALVETTSDRTNIVAFFFFAVQILSSSVTPFPREKSVFLPDNKLPPLCSECCRCADFASC